MAVSDRWHRAPGEGDKPCACGRGRNRLYPSSVHGTGKRWLVRWRDPATGKQKAKSFALKEGKNAGLHADAFDAKIQREIDTRTYVDPDAGEVTFRAYAEQLRTGRRIPDPAQAADLERRLRLHAYEGMVSGQTPTGAPSIGQHPVGLLAQRVSLVAAWADGIRLSPRRKRRVMGDVSWVFRMAQADGIVTRDPVHAETVGWPEAGRKLARAWTPAQCAAMRAELPERWRVLVDLGAATGQRQGEMLGLGTDDVDWLAREEDDPQVRVVRQLKWVEGKPYFAPVKNRKPHSAPLAAELRDALSLHLAAHPAVEVTLPWWEPEDAQPGGRHLKPVTVRLVVTNARGKPVEPHSLANTWRKARRRAGITPPDGREREDGCHALRHMFASSCLRAGIDPVRVAEWMGDTVKTVIDVYAHFLPGRSDADARRAIGAFLAPPEDGSSARNVHGGGLADASAQGNGGVLQSRHVSGGRFRRRRSEACVFESAVLTLDFYL